jgi:lipoprotein-anchoring transpeptidase ErfK/SrfK
MAWRCLLLAVALVSSVCAQPPAAEQPVPPPAVPAPPAEKPVPPPEVPVPPQKHVVVDKAKQELVAYEGDVEVLRTRVSTGRMGKRTPSGSYTAGYKQRMHRSKLYNNAPMPFSVQFNGNYFIHGFTSVPKQPASHGCIRMPLDGDNPAKRFYEWAEEGMPIEVVGEWAPPPPPPRKKKNAR